MADQATDEQIRLAKRGSPGIVDKDQLIARIEAETHAREKWQRAVSDLGTKALERAKRIAQLRDRIAELEGRVKDQIVFARQRIAELEGRLAVALECIADGIDDHWVEYPEHAKLIKEARGDGGAAAAYAAKPLAERLEERRGSD